MPAELQAHPSPRPLRWDPFIDTLLDLLGPKAAEVYLVGGIVRDAFWGLPAHDVDLAVSGSAFNIARRIANALDGAFYKLDPERETGRAIVMHEGRQWVVDVATFRGDSLLDDLTGRDFTLNAVAAPLTGALDQVIDPLNGLQDAQDRILRRCSPTAIQEDPIRALRAIRQSVRFKLRIEPQTRQDIHQYGPNLQNTSPERIRDEFFAVLGGNNPTAALRALDALGLLDLIVPEVAPMRGVTQSAPHQYDVWEHTLQTTAMMHGVLQTISPQRTDNTAAQAGLGMIVYYLDKHRAALQAHIVSTWANDRPHAALLLLAALLHDSGKPATRQEQGDRVRFLQHEHIGAEFAALRGEALHLSRPEITRLTTIIQHHLRPHLLAQQGQVSRRAVYRFWRDCGPAGVDVCLLALADYLATFGTTLDTEVWGRYLQTIDTLLTAYFAPPEQNMTTLSPLITGTDLIKGLNVPQGPRIGEILEQVREAQAIGDITTRDEALSLARHLIDQA